MNKIEMRDWVSALEQVVENKLKGWKKESRIENGECVQIEWQFEQTHIIIDIFWHDHEELVKLHIFGPRVNHGFTWHGLTNRTFNKVQDRIGNMIGFILNPPLDIPDHG